MNEILILCCSCNFFQALFMPYDHKNTTPEGLPSQRMRLMLEKLNRFQLNDRCLVGSGGGSVGLVSLTHHFYV